MSENLKFITPELFLVIFNLSFLIVMLFSKSHAILSNGNKILEDIYELLETISDWNEEQIDLLLKEYQSNNKLKVPEVNQPIRIALTGSTKSPSLGLTLSLFDKKEALKRIANLISFLS